MDSTSLTKPVDLQGLSLALAKTKADYMAYVDAYGGNTYSLSINNNVITLTGSDGSTSSVTLPVFGGTAADVWEGGAY